FGSFSLCFCGAGGAFGVAVTTGLRGAGAASAGGAIGVAAGGGATTTGGGAVAAGAGALRLRAHPRVPRSRPRTAKAVPAISPTTIAAPSKAPARRRHQGRIASRSAASGSLASAAVFGASPEGGDAAIGTVVRNRPLAW